MLVVTILLFAIKWDFEFIFYLNAYIVEIIKKYPIKLPYGFINYLPTI